MTDDVDRIAALREQIDDLARRELELRLERATLCALAVGDGMTQDQLARALGLGQTTISYWVRWAEFIDVARDVLDDKFICSYHAVSGILNGDFTTDEQLTIVERAAAFSLNGQPTELDVFETVCRVPAFRRKYGSVPGLHRRRSY